MKKYFTALIFSILSTVVAADSNLKYIDENCKRAYSTFEELLQFFYKFEGNLPEIKESKIKSLKFLDSRWKDESISISLRMQTFKELWEDSDYHQLQLQEASYKLIKELEEIKKNSNPVKDKNLIYSLPNVSSFGDYQNPYKKLKEFTRIQNNVRDFFEELEKRKSKIEMLGQQERLNKSLDNNAQNFAYRVAFYKKTIPSIIDCNLEYLEAKRTSK